ncbi:hypothetical protein [Amycolatopsis circi]|nr:hypothetical protein [Amycolatopsis circi]
MAWSVGLGYGKCVGSCTSARAGPVAAVATAVLTAVFLPLATRQYRQLGR